MPGPATAARLRDVLACRGVAWLFAAQTQSQLGDQVARVALAILVFQQTGSAVATSAVFALTFVPAIAGGMLLGSLADRAPRRTLMVYCDLLRAALVGLMTLPQLPLGLLYALVAASVLLGTPFASAQMALLAELVGTELYPTATGYLRGLDQVAGLVGYSIGGVLVAAVGARTGLLIDCLSFLVSGIVLQSRVVVLPRRAASSTDRNRTTVFEMARLVLGEPRLRKLLGLACVVGLYVVPEALAAPYAAQIGAGAAAVGALLASVSVGAAVGSIVLVRWVPQQARSAVVAALAVGTAIPLVACWSAPGLAVSLILWAVAGSLSAYVVLATASFTVAIPDSTRGTAIALGSSLLLASQGVAALIGGGIAARLSPSTTIAICAVAGAALAVWFSVSGLRARYAQPAAGKHRLVTR